MANSLYDLLEVNQSASPEAIQASYKRLYAKQVELAAKGNEDATNYLVALRDAFGTLSDADKRRRYDERLAAKETPLEMQEVTAQFIRKPIFALLALVIAGLILAGYRANLERTRLETERVRLELERSLSAAREAEQKLELARQESQARLAAERAENQRRRDEATELANRERDMAYANQVSRNLERAEAENLRKKEREEQRETQRREQAERQRLQDAERQLAREKAYLRQVEQENRRTHY
ncbi:MAG: DnaJ domain-containing protein [Dechloromonas sp.]|nr:MAG: DnaJ domain-containing protein [Dechloromonas sp.]